MNDFLVEVHNLTKSFRISEKKGFSRFVSKIKSSQNEAINAIDNVTFSLKKGEVLGIIGTNGSGKTTLLRLIAGVYKPDSGSVIVHGRMSPLMQIGAGFQGEFAAKENIIINGMLLGLSKSEIENKVDSIIKYAELEKFSNLKLKHYSSGMKSRLAFSTAMQVDPDILLVDEILSVGDKNFKHKSYETFLSLKNQNKTIIHASHNLTKMAEFSDKILYLNKGKMIMFGEPDKVINQYEKSTST